MNWLRPVQLSTTSCVAVATPSLSRTIRPASRLTTTFPRKPYRREQSKCFSRCAVWCNNKNGNWHDTEPSKSSNILGKNIISKDALNLNRSTQECRKENNATEQKHHVDEHISLKKELLLAERKRNDRLSRTTQDQSDHVKYLEHRLKEEAHLRLQYSDKESRILADARYTQLLWATVEKTLRSAPRKVVDWIKMILVVIVAFPFVISLAAAPVWAAIMVYASLALKTMPVIGSGEAEETDLSMILGEGSSSGRGDRLDDAVVYNHGVVDLLGWVIVAGVLAAPLLLPTSNL